MINQNKSLEYFKLYKCVFIIGIFLISSFAYSEIWSSIYKLDQDQNSIIILTPDNSDYAIDLAVSSIMNEINTLDSNAIVNDFQNLDNIINYVKNRYRNNIIIIIGHGSKNGFQIGSENLISWNNFGGDIFTRSSKLPIIFLSCYSNSIESDNNNLIKFTGEIDSEAGAQISLIHILFNFYNTKLIA